MVINSSVPSSNSPAAANSPVAPQGRQSSSIGGNDAPLPSITEDNSDLPTEEIVQRNLESARQSILQQSNQALLSMGKLSPDTVFSLLQD